MTTPSAASLPAATFTCQCGHLPIEHDRVALRYCQATTEGSLDRGCICPSTLALPSVDDGRPGT